MKTIKRWLARVDAFLAPNGGRELIKRFRDNRAGVTAIEYGLIAAGVAVAIVVVVQGLGSALNTTFGSVSTALK